MADDYPNQVSQPTEQVTVDSVAFYIQAQHKEVIVPADAFFGSRASMVSMASAGSAASRAARDARPARPAYSSSGSTASVASAASTASQTGTISRPSIASQGSVVAIAAEASIASKAALAASQGSVASVASDASTVEGVIGLVPRNKQQPCTIKVEGDAASHVILSMAGSSHSIDNMDALIIPAWASRTITAKTPHNVDFPKFLIT